MYNEDKRTFMHNGKGMGNPKVCGSLEIAYLIYYLHRQAKRRVTHRLNINIKKIKVLRLLRLLKLNHKVLLLRKSIEIETKTSSIRNCTPRQRQFRIKSMPATIL